jgi:hypothetical protein
MKAGRPVFLCLRRGPVGNEPRASALILVLWAVMLLSMAILAWVQWIQHGITLAGEANGNADARAMAHSGVAMALHPMVGEQSPQLNRQFGAQLGYRVKMMSEGGKLNLNWLLAGEDPVKLQIFKKWLESQGLDFRQRAALVDSLLDYVDADNVRRLNGLEDEGDYHPANRPLLDLEELRTMRGAEDLIEKLRWRAALTLWSSGPIDLMSAPLEILRLVPGVGESKWARFVTFRAGQDGVLGTRDDPPFKSLRDVQLFLGMSDQQFKPLSGLVGMRDPVVWVLAEGQAGKVIRQVEVVARKGGPNASILSWKE